MILAASTLAVLIALIGFGAYIRAMLKSAQAVKKFPVTGKLLNVNGTNIHATVIGAGPDLVMIHGSSGNLRDFTTSLAPRLAKTYRVVLIDRPGLGHSDSFDPNGETLRDQALMLRDAALQIGVQKPLVLGHSFGGAVALAWALHAPDNLSGLILLSAPSHPWPTGLSAFYKAMSAPLLGPFASLLISAFASEKAIQKSLTETFQPQPVPQGYRASLGIELYLRPPTLLSNARQRRILKQQIREMAPNYPKITAPVEILHGTSDDIVSFELHAKALARDIPTATLTELKGMGHMPHHCDQDAVRSAINRAAERAGLRLPQ